MFKLTIDAMRLFVFSLLVIAASALHAQSFSATSDVSALKKKVIQETQKLNSIECDFTQEKNLSMLSEKAVSKGKFYFKKEDKVRLEYLQPVKNVMVMNGGKLTIKDDKKTTQTDMHRSRMFQQLNNIIVGSINGSLFQSKDFVTTFTESSSQVKIELKPVSKTLKNFLSTVVLILEKKDFTAARLEMNEPSGDNTILTFSKKQINGEVSDSLFVIK